MEGDGGTHGLKGRKPHFDIAFGYVTSWGRKPIAYLSATSADLILFAETHLRQKELEAADFRDSIRKAGFKCTASAAASRWQGWHPWWRHAPAQEAP